MSVEPLIQFDHNLCEYALGQIRSHLLGRPLRSTVPARVSPAEFEELTLPVWIERAVASMPTPLAGLIWDGLIPEGSSRLPSSDELFDLAASFDDPPLRREAEATWLAHEPTHSRFVTCLPAIQARLGGPMADLWSALSIGYAAQLDGPELPLAEGIAVVHDWVRRLRQLIHAIRELEAMQIQTHAQPEIPILRDEPRVREWTGDEYLTPTEIAVRYPISLSAIYGACRTGQLTHHRVRTAPSTRGKYLIRMADLQVWLNAQRVVGEGFTTSASAPASSPQAPALPFSELNPQRLAKAWKT